MDKLPDDVCRSCTGILYAYNRTTAPKDSQGRPLPRKPTMPLCIGISKTMPGRLHPSQLAAIERDIPGPLNGRIVSFGETQYCGYMVRRAKYPLCTLGFQVRILVDPESEEHDGTRDNSSNWVGPGVREKSSGSLLDQVYGRGSSNKPGAATPETAPGSAGAAGAPSSSSLGRQGDSAPVPAPGTAPGGVGGGSAGDFGDSMLRSCKRLWGSCASLGGEVEKAVSKEGMGKKFIVQTKVLSGAMGDTASRIKEGSKKLYKLATSGSSNQPPGGSAAGGSDRK